MFALAATLGMTVRELEDRMGSAELSEWLALLRVEPWGPYRSDLSAAIVAWSSAAPWCKEAKLGDFMPDYGGTADREPVEQNEEQAIARLKLKLAAMGGTPVNG